MYDVQRLTIDARRSLRASRDRRGAALRRRRVLRGRRAALLMASVFAITATGALAAPAGRDLPPSTVKAAQRALGVSADGIVGPQTRKAVRRHQRRAGLTVDGILGPQTLRSLGVTGAGAKDGARTQTTRTGATPEEDDDPSQPAGADAATLARIAQCESGGDPTAISPDGRYRGKYQFDRETWARMGGSGDPAAAPEAEQDARAARLLREAGTGPWPNCA